MQLVLWTQRRNSTINLSIHDACPERLPWCFNEYPVPVQLVKQSKQCLMLVLQPCSADTLAFLAVSLGHLLVGRAAEAMCRSSG